MGTAFGEVTAMTGRQRAALADEFDRASRLAVAEPVAVVGVGCRFPGGVSGPESYWRLLVDGVDAITRIPCGSVGCRGVLRSGSVGSGADDDEVGRIRLGCGRVRCRFFRYRPA